jgi:hypothetical protein
VDITKRSLHQKLEFGDGENQCKFGFKNYSKRLYPIPISLWAPSIDVYQIFVTNHQLPNFQGFFVN